VYPLPSLPMASPASTSAPVSLSLPLRPSPCRLLPAAFSRPSPRRLALAPARPAAALLSSPSPSQAQHEDDEEEEEEEEEEYGEDEELVEEDELVEVGYVSGAHGVRGDVLVSPRTDFPELRFATPGKRWLRARAAGKMQVRELELLRGKAHTGKKGWIVRFDGVDSLDEARQIVGSAVLVKTEDRPELEEDEIYSLDLVGMSVIVKDTGKLVGTVAQVFNFGGGDLLQVMVGSAENAVQTDSENQDSTPSRQHVWIPFAEDIVPDIDMESREMWITPPKGLLEVNTRPEKSKKERRAMDWKEKKKLQRRITAAKKVLHEMEQGHILEGLLSGDKLEKASLAEQIASIDFQLFKHAMHSVSKQVDSMSKNVLANSSSRKNVMRIPRETLMNHGEKGKNVFSTEFSKGREILQKSKAAIVLVTNGSDSDIVDAEFQRLLNSFSELMKVEENHISPPFVIISPDNHVDSVRNYLVENDYFGFDTQKVWVLEEMKLPVVSLSSELESKKILLKSPWEILQRPAGTGAIFSSLSSNKILESFNAMGIEYVQICSLSDELVLGHPLLFGAASSRGVDVGVKLRKTSDKTEDGFDLVLSIDHLNKMCRDVAKARFSAHPEQHEHMEHVDGQWVTVQPEAANSHRLSTDVTSVLDSCSPDKLCVMEIVE
uniref:RimM N-terminal domain-containing protein n=7 Tax=Aegilops tauschii TaxID=37682 RepID=A0A452ZXB2_AEGTS